MDGRFLGIKCTYALSHPQVDVDESIAQAATMVDTELGFAKAIAAGIQAAAFDVVAGQTNIAAPPGSAAGAI